MKHKVSNSEALRLLFEGSQALTDIEQAGVRVDTKYVGQAITQAQTEEKDFLKKMESDDTVMKPWRKRYGQKTNITSREQLATVLFKDLGIESVGKTEKGRDRTDVEALDRVDLPYVKNFLAVQKLKKVMGTYFAGVKKHSVKHPDGFWYVHPTYLLNTAVTYRSSSTQPNFQNIPTRDPSMAARIRKCYLPHPGHRIVEVDFGQIEVRVAYCLHKDPTMGQYLHDPTTDMHRDTAAELFFLTYDQVIQGKKTVRHSAKNEFVFPEFYGSVYFQCAKNIWDSMVRGNWTVPGTDKPLVKHLRKNGIKECGDCIPGQSPGPNTFERHVKNIEDLFWNKRFPVYTAWKRKFYSRYLRNGGFDTVTGFRINGVFSRNDVINYPVQGPAFHCLLWVLIELSKWMRKYKLKSKIIGEIHDSAILSVDPREEQTVIDKITTLMTKELPKAWKWIICPIEVEVECTGVDESWYTKKLWTLQGSEWGLKT